MKWIAILLVLGVVLVGMSASAISGDNAMEEHGDDWNEEERGKDPASGSDGDTDYIHGPAHNSDEDDEDGT